MSIQSQTVHNSFKMCEDDLVHDSEDIEEHKLSQPPNPSVASDYTIDRT